MSRFILGRPTNLVEFRLRLENAFAEASAGNPIIPIGRAEFSIACLCFPEMVKSWIRKVKPESRLISRGVLIVAESVVVEICRECFPLLAARWIVFMCLDIAAKISWKDLQKCADYLASDVSAIDLLLQEMPGMPPEFILGACLKAERDNNGECNSDDGAGDKWLYSGEKIESIAMRVGFDYDRDGILEIFPVEPAFARETFSRIGTRGAARLFRLYPCVSPAWLYAIYGGSLVEELCTRLTRVGLAGAMAHESEYSDGISPGYFLELVVILGLGKKEDWLPSRGQTLLDIALSRKR